MMLHDDNRPRPGARDGMEGMVGYYTLENM
eukprot:COSAG01_NODE_64932_length_274_cov_100.920000_1_plen_29_part_01